jgi:hypothetical protein
LVLAHAGATILLGAGVLLGMVWADLHLGSAWSNDPREIGTSLVVVWFAVLAGLGWLAPRKQHLWVLGGVLGIGVALWGWLGPSLFPQFQNPRQLHSYGVSPVIVCLLIGGSLVPLIVTLLGMLSPGCFRRRTA